MLSNKDEQLFVTLSRISTLLHRQLDTVFHDNGVTPTQFSVLEVLYSKGNLCVKDIQHAILSTAGNVPVVIQNLLKLGYIQKQTNAQDKRKSIISLTKTGKEKVEIIYPLQRAALHDMLANVSHEQKQTLLTLLLSLYRTLSH